MFGASVLIVCISGALSKNQDAFTYITPWNQFRRSYIECDMCYNNVCLTSDGARCEYYTEASKILDDDHETGDEDTEIEYKIDDMLFEYVDKASSSAMLMNCVPLISQYTDCTGENICTGCKVCNCDAVGRWNCSVTEQCRPSPRVSVDHRVLGVIIESLKNYENTQKVRVKRSTNAESSLDNKDTITGEDISKWLYGAEPLSFEKELNSGDVVVNVKDTEDVVINTESYTETSYYTTLLSDIDNDLFSPLNSTVSNITSDAEILVFDDILRGLTINDLKNNRSLKYNAGRSDQYLQNVLHPMKTNDVEDADYDPLRLVKRDTSNISKINKTEILEKENQTLSNNNTIESEYNKSIEYFIEALFSVNQLINEKQKEIRELKHVQENLINFARMYTNTNITLNVTSNNTSETKHHIIIYKMDTLGECLDKIKQNVYNAIEDITKMNTLGNSTNLTKDFKVLLRAMKYFIYIEGNKHHRMNLSKIITSEGNKDSLRRIMEGKDIEAFNAINDLRNIFEEVNKITSPYKTLSHLSEITRKIIKRIIKRFYLDEFDALNYASYYGLENDLENIGTNWQKLTQDIADSSSQDKLYRMKILYLKLNADIGKMEDTLALITFAQTRRMTIAKGALIEQSILSIKNNLRQIDHKVQQLMKSPPALRMKNNALKKQKEKKMSLIQRMKTLFKNSRNEIRNLLHKKMPKAEIIKRIAKKKISELDKEKLLKHEETMKRWQETLNVFPRRRKRSTWGFQNFIDRLKNIIPSYLRGKVRPAISKKSANRTRSAKTHDRKKKKKTSSTTARITKETTNH